MSEILVPYPAMFAMSQGWVFGELASVCAEGMLRRYCDAWFAAAKRRGAGDAAVRFPRRRRRLVPVRFRRGRFILQDRRLRLAAVQGRPPLWVRLDRDVPYPAGGVRSLTLVVSGRAIRAETHLHLKDTKYRRRAAAGRAPEEP